MASSPCIEGGRWTDDLDPELCDRLLQRASVEWRGRRVRERGYTQIDEELLKAAWHRDGQYACVLRRDDVRMGHAAR